MNNKCKLLIILSLVFMFASIQVQAERFKGPIVKKNTPKGSANCFAPAKTTELSLNNVRALLKTNGTMWFAEKAEYEVPKGSGQTSMFSAALWIGGMDKDKQLYVAAMRFAQVGNDFWTGPLQMKDGAVTPATCSYYDKFYRMTRVEVERHIRAFQENDGGYGIPKSILDWPAHPRHANTGESQFLAPFYNVGGDPNVYEPELGDYPYYDFPNELCPWTSVNLEQAKLCSWINESGECDSINGRIANPAALRMPPERIWTRQQVKDYGWDNMMIYADHVLKGDETIFWFLNDNGGPHKESGSERAIGLEIRVQAFAFATNDELNKMTFYSYEIINRGSNTLNDTYFSQWVDPDLGDANDDYVGCDVIRGMGYCYNGKDVDGTGNAWAYGENPPAVGVDFFQGPYIDADGADNPRFYKDMADINSNNVSQQEYCKRFVKYIYDRFDPNDANLYDKFYEITINGKKDTIRWNDQFAINGVNFGDGIVDNERFGMRRFVYHNNDGSPTGDPRTAMDYYRMLQGIWKDGEPMQYGGTAYQTGGTVCDFMFPQGTDYCNWGTRGVDPGETYNKGGKTGSWSEEHPKGPTSKPNDPADRRFMQSAGPFQLRQGACNYITVGIPWARATQGGRLASVALLMVADDKCQALFENCFKIIDGPDAPNLTIREYDQRLIMLLSNSPLSNNANEDYRELDGTTPEWLAWVDSVDRYYNFEGYQIFQVIGPEVGANDLDNPDLARLIRQYDLVNFDQSGNPIGTLINWEYDEAMQLSVPRTKVTGSNAGIEHSFEITQDAFATGNRQLVNYKTYYFIAIAYAYNQYFPFSIDPNFEHGLEGQKFPYLRGRKTAEGTSVVPIAAVPHPPTLHGGGATMNSDYGYIPNITRIDGQGNGGIALDLTQETIDKIVKGGDKGDYRVRELKYEKNAGPLSVKVVDPLRVKPFDFTLVIKDTILDKKNLNNPMFNDMDVSNDAYWVLTIDDNVSDEELIAAGLEDADGYAIREFTSQTSIGQYYEQIIFPLGISVSIKNAYFVNRQPKVVENWDRIVRESMTLDPFVKLKKDAIYRATYMYGQSEKIEINNDIIFANNGHPWIVGLVDDNALLPSNWIRAGSNNLGVWDDTNTISVQSKYDQWRLEDACMITNKIVHYDPQNHQYTRNERAYKDYGGKFGSVCGGTWAPYVLTSPYDNGPQAKYYAPEPSYNSSGDLLEPTSRYYKFQDIQNVPATTQPGYNQTMTNLYSVNVVITPDQSLWTRCVVLESCSDPTKSIGGALKSDPRKSKSVGKDGKPDNSTDGFGENGDEGMGWFPGYAINLETGERLNIMFAENSDTTLKQFNHLVHGNDMVFNPTSTYAMATKDTIFAITINNYTFLQHFVPGMQIAKPFYDQLYDLDNADGSLERAGIVRVWGGMHYVYVCGSSGNTSPIYYLDKGLRSGGNTFLKTPRRNFNLNDTTLLVGDGTLNGTFYGGFIDEEKQYPNYDLGPYDEGRWLVQKFKQFVDKDLGYFAKNSRMQLFNNVMYTHIPMQSDHPDYVKEWMSCDVTYKIRVTRPYMRYVSRWYESPELRDQDYTVPDNLNYRGFPVYKFSTTELTPTFNDTRLYQSILDNINIVPNPYYGGSFYEKNALDNQVKIINLPTDLKNDAPVTINIFTVNGILVRTLTKGDSETSYVNWDLKNHANIPVAGGVYIIHVNCPGIGERMLKFFCTMRPTDLNNF